MRRLVALILGVVALLLVAPATVGASGPLSVEWTLPVGSVTHDVALQGDFAYVATNAGLVVIDISDPLDLNRSLQDRVVGAVNAGKSQGVAVAWPYVYLAQATALKVIDVSVPDAPVVRASRAIPYPWAVALKDNAAYVSSFAGELYVYDVSNPLDPRRVRVLGLPAWKTPGPDASGLQKLNSYVATGSAKATDVSVSGNHLVTVDWGYGRLYYYDVTNALAPVFRGTHYAPYILSAEIDEARDVIYMLSAYGRSSGIYTVPISQLAPNRSTFHGGCAACAYIQNGPFVGLDQGGLAVSDSGGFVAYGGGRNAGEFHVVEVDSHLGHPFQLQDVAVMSIGGHGVSTAQIMGVKTRGDLIFHAAGALGLRLYSFPGLGQ